ncbi:codeine O-demethylase-like [Prunus avium]|uniref:Codeine O-demethylase-like n=1 Tax=Prunus avium TaxID=42229 RepID=A0A6P5SCG6_PRUAV|nr:codeine O-demethylase-like [Prunus avium]XP_021812087.1 codeine O-demethylase-like [Prunus avium]
MAESSSTIAKPKIELGSKTVQELLLLAEGEQVPENYIHKVGAPYASSVQLKDIPVIDLGLLLTPSSITQQQLDNFQSALTTWGCFQVINHGMTPEFLDKVREMTKQFFALPVEEKQKYLRHAQVNDIQGYGNDTVFSEQQRLDWSDRLYLSVYPEEHRELKFWPQNPKSFSETLDQYTTKLQVVTKTVLEAMARSLNLDVNCFWDLYGEQGRMDLRFNFYPPCSRPDVVLGVKPHSDSSLITLLLQDKQVEGLQFLKDDQWFRAPIIPEALLINVGDQAEILSNGILKSPVHRVVINPDTERISLAAFCMPESDKEIEPLESLVNESTQRLYKKMKNYESIYFEYYQQGRRPIEASKI